MSTGATGRCRGNAINSRTNERDETSADGKAGPPSRNNSSPCPTYSITLTHPTLTVLIVRSEMAAIQSQVFPSSYEMIGLLVLASRLYLGASSPPTKTPAAL